MEKLHMSNSMGSRQHKCKQDSNNNNNNNHNHSSNHRSKAKMMVMEMEDGQPKRSKSPREGAKSFNQVTGI
jgi:hypothetical protein